MRRCTTVARGDRTRHGTPGRVCPRRVVHPGKICGSPLSIPILALCRRRDAAPAQTTGLGDGPRHFVKSAPNGERTHAEYPFCALNFEVRTSNYSPFRTKVSSSDSPSDSPSVLLLCYIAPAERREIDSAAGFKGLKLPELLESSKLFGVLKFIYVRTITSSHSLAPRRIRRCLDAGRHALDQPCSSARHTGPQPHFRPARRPPASPPALPWTPPARCPTHCPCR